jgi:hypothetical protein
MYGTHRGAPEENGYSDESASAIGQNRSITFAFLRSFEKQGTLDLFMTWIASLGKVPINALRTSG